MNKIFVIDGFVEVTHELEMAAIRLKYLKLNDPSGTNIPTVVKFAAEFATLNGIKNWIADTELPTDDLSEKDAKWVATQEFRDILPNSTIDKFVLIPAPADSGVDISWIPDWRDATEAGFGGKIGVRVMSNSEEIGAFFLSQ